MRRQAGLPRLLTLGYSIKHKELIMPDDGSNTTFNAIFLPLTGFVLSRTYQITAGVEFEMGGFKMSAEQLDSLSPWLYALWAIFAVIAVHHWLTEPESPIKSSYRGFFENGAASYLADKAIAYRRFRVDRTGLLDATLVQLRYDPLSGRDYDCEMTVVPRVVVIHWVIKSALSTLILTRHVTSRMLPLLPILLVVGSVIMRLTKL
jgi:hypothetical protein